MRGLGVLAPALVLVLAAGIIVADPAGMFSRSREAVFDAYQRLRPRTYEPAPVRVVDLDDESLARLGQWPWPRTRLADLVGALAAAGAAAIVFDMVFAEPDRTSPGNLARLWRERGGIGIDEGLATALRGLPDHDAAFAAAVEAAGMVVTGFVLTGAPSGSAPQPALKAGFAAAGDPPERFAPGWPGAVSTLPGLEAAAAGNGFFNFTADQDLIVRRVPLVMTHRDRLYPSLTAEALRVAQGARSYVVRASNASGQTAFGAESGINAVRIGALTAPTDAGGHLRLHYAGLVDERVVPAWRVLEPNFDPAAVEGAIVVVGASAAGLMDLRASPLDPAMPGYLAHVEAMEQILLGHFLQRPDWAPGAELAFLAGVGAALILLMRRLGALAAAGAGAGTVALAIGWSWRAYTDQLLLLDPVTPSVALLLVYFTGSLLSYLRSETERRQVRAAFAHYLSPDLVRQLAADPGRLRLGGERKRMTVLFCDVRGFTSISESHRDDPEGLTRLINRLLTPLTEALLERRATIDKYMGDCIMAFWNAPLDDPHHAAHACEGALAMMAALEALNAELAAEAAAEGRSVRPLAVGVGINSGDCVVGNMGSRQRFDYSVLGDAVNLASRLEGQSKAYGVDVVIGDGTRALVPDWATLELDLIAVKGKTERVRIHALLGPPAAAADPAFRALAERHAAMLAAYRAQDWDAAGAALAEVERMAAAWLDLSSLVALYRARLEAFRRDPPGPDWDGVYVATSK